MNQRLKNYCGTGQKCTALERNNASLQAKLIEVEGKANFERK
jgi:hypothetical protein